MNAFFITVDGGLMLLVVPEVSVHLDGHPVLTESYRIFRSDNLITANHGGKPDPNYRGTISFEHPDKLFNYIADGPEQLSTAEVQQAITEITAHREHPERW